MKLSDKLLCGICHRAGSYLASINYTHGHTNSEKLLEMVMLNNIVGVSFVLGNGADVNAVAEYYNKFSVLISAVYISILIKNTDMLEIVLTTPKLDINAMNVDGYTALSFAEEYTQKPRSSEIATKIVDMLKKAGATK